MSTGTGLQFPVPGQCCWVGRFWWRFLVGWLVFLQICPSKRAGSLQKWEGQVEFLEAAQEC